MGLCKVLVAGCHGIELNHGSWELREAQNLCVYLYTQSTAADRRIQAGFVERCLQPASKDRQWPDHTLRCRLIGPHLGQLVL